jgi:outer membrane protein assembly factor BamB
MAMGALANFDTWVSAAALAVSAGGLIPIFVIKEDRRKELAIVLVVSLLIALTGVMAVRNQEHASEVREIEKEIVGTLSGNRWTSDQLYKQLHFPHREIFFEALFGAVDQSRVQQAVVQVRIDDGPAVDVRLYWVEPGKAQTGETSSANPRGVTESEGAQPSAWLRPAMEAIVGVSGDFDNLRGYLSSIDPENGKTQWTWYSTPPEGTPGATTGGTTWMTGTYDPGLNLLYWGTGNPTAVLNGKARPGDDLYTCSIVALNPDLGKLVWAFQPSPHDTHDWDAVETPVLVDAEFKGQPRKMLMQTSRNGYFFVLDRTNGESLLTTPFGPVNWAKGVDAKGQPIPNPDKEPAPDGRLVAPDEGGLTNYRSPSFDPTSGLFIVDAHPAYGIYFAKPADGEYGWAGADYTVWGKGVLQAIDYKSGKTRWTHELGPYGSGAGVLTTDSGVTFTGDANGNFLAVRTSDGKTLWHSGSGGHIESSPITYELDGRQYMLTSSSGLLFAFALPESLAPRKLTTE